MVLVVGLFFAFFSTFLTYLLTIEYFVVSYAQSTITTNLEPGSCLLAVGDLHGDYENAIRVFKMAGIIDKKLKWAARNCTFVQTGDIVDRVRLYISVATISTIP